MYRAERAGRGGAGEAFRKRKVQGVPGHTAEKVGKGQVMNMVNEVQGQAIRLHPGANGLPGRVAESDVHKQSF